MLRSPSRTLALKNQCTSIQYLAEWSRPCTAARLWQGRGRDGVAPRIVPACWPVLLRLAERLDSSPEASVFVTEQSVSGKNQGFPGPEPGCIVTEQIVDVTKQCCVIKNECRSATKPHCLLKKQYGLEPMSCCNFKKQYDFKPKQCVAGVAGATSLMESDFHATKQINFAANQCCNFKKQGCSAINQCVTVTDRIVFTTEKSVGVTRITRAVRKLSVSVAKKSINDALPVISETE